MSVIFKKEIDATKRDHDKIFVNDVRQLNLRGLCVRVLYGYDHALRQLARFLLNVLSVSLCLCCLCRKYYNYIITPIKSLWVSTK